MSSNGGNNLQDEEQSEFDSAWDALDKYNNQRRDPGHLPRMSLYKQFDPLLGQTGMPPPSSTASAIKNTAMATGNETENDRANNTVPETENDDAAAAGIIGNAEETLNKTSTLIYLNTPMTKKIATSLETTTETTVAAATNGDNYQNNHHSPPPQPSPADDSRHQQQQIVQMNEEIGNLEAKNEMLELLMGQLTLANEELLEIVNKKMSHLKETLEQKDEELSKLVLIKSQLEEDINGVEKNYYEIHSRYDNLRTLVVEMDAKESQTNVKLQELIQRLKDKEQECCRLRLQAEEAMQNVSQRQAANSENVSLKAQVKVLEMKVNGLQSQIEQKNKENDELTNIVNDLINSKN